MHFNKWEHNQKIQIYSNRQTTATGLLVTHVLHLIYVGGDRGQQYFLSGPRGEINQDHHRVGLLDQERLVTSV